MSWRPVCVLPLLFGSADAAFAQFDPTPGLDAFVASAPTRVTAQNGDYFSPATWQNGVPGPLDTVRIDHLVTCTNRPITVKTLIISASGAYADLPGDGNCAITIANAPLNPAADPEQYGHGIVVLGEWHVEGQAKVRWTWLTTELVAGQQTLTGVSTTGWAVGDRLVVPDVRGNTPQTYTVASLAVSLDRPVTIPAPATRGDNGMIERYAPIGNLSASVVIRSADPQGVRGHFLATRDARVTLRAVAFQDFGRTTNEPLHPATNHVGRYALHLHHMSAAPIVEGVVIERALRWGLTVHHTNGGTFRNNLIFQAHGAGVMTEDGSEHDNLFERNFVIDVRGTGGRGDERPGEVGLNGSAFWFEGPLNRVVGNIGTNSVQGFVVYGEGAAGLLAFEDNEGIGNGINLSIWYLQSAQPTYVDRFYSRGAGFGYYGYPTTNVIFRDFTSRGTLPNNGVGWWAGDYSTVDGQLIRPRISGYHWGIFLPYGATDNPPPDVMREFRVSDGVLADNDFDITTRRGSVSSWGGIQPHLVSRVLNTLLRSSITVRREVDYGGGGRHGPHPDQLFVNDCEVFYADNAPWDAVPRTGVQGLVRCGGGTTPSPGPSPPPSPPPPSAPGDSDSEPSPGQPGPRVCVPNGPCHEHTWPRVP